MVWNVKKTWIAYRYLLICAIVCILWLPAYLTALAGPVGEKANAIRIANWPNGFQKDSDSFHGGAFDGKNVWMAPYDADRIVKINVADGEMGSIRAFPDGYTYTSGAFSGAVYDGTSVWFIPFNAERLIKIDPITLKVSYGPQWPSDFKKMQSAFDGGVVIGDYLWLIPHASDKLLRLNIKNFAWDAYSKWPNNFSHGNGAFSGGVASLDGGTLWLVPSDANMIVKVNASNGEMTGNNAWPIGFSKTNGAFSGGATDGNGLWLAPKKADKLVRLDLVSGGMTSFAKWPAGMSIGINAFSGAIYDGRDIWLTPYGADRIVRVKTNGEMSAPITWPNGLNRGIQAFQGSVFDGSDLWLIPSSADAVLELVGNRTPTANGSSIQLTEDIPYSGLLSASDLDADPLKFTVVKTPSKGVLTWINDSTGNYKYTPNLNANGSDTFTYRVSDGVTFSSEATVSVSIANENDPPVVNALTIQAREDESKTGIGIANDPELDALEYQIVSNGSKGTFTFTNNKTGEFLYVPTPDQNGSDEVSVRVKDGKLFSNTVKWQVNIVPVNDMPIAKDVTLQTNEDLAVQSNLKASDIDGDALSYEFIQQPTHGNVMISDITKGTVIYKPDENYFGSDQFVYTVSDGLLTSAPANVKINIAPIDDAPELSSANFTVVQGVSLHEQLTASDLENDPLTFEIVSPPTHGKWSWINAADGRFTYEPELNWTGIETIQVDVTDNVLKSEVKSISIVVSPTVKKPVEVKQEFQVTSGVYTVNRLNVPNSEQNDLTFALMLNPGKGKFEWIDNQHGYFYYQSKSGFIGDDEFEYLVKDSGIYSEMGKIILHVLAATNAPINTVSPTPSPTSVPTNKPTVSITPSPTPLIVNSQSPAVLLSNTPAPTVLVSASPNATSVNQQSHTPSPTSVINVLTNNPNATSSSTPIAPVATPVVIPQIVYIPYYIEVTPIPTATSTPVMIPNPTPTLEIKKINVTVTPVPLSKVVNMPELHSNHGLDWVEIDDQTLNQEISKTIPLKIIGQKNKEIQFEEVVNDDQKVLSMIMNDQLVLRPNDSFFTINFSGKRVSKPVSITIRASDRMGNWSDQIVLVDVREVQRVEISALNDVVLPLPEEWKMQLNAGANSKKAAFMKVVKIPVTIEVQNRDEEMMVSAQTDSACGLQVDGFNGKSILSEDESSRTYYLNVVVTDRSSLRPCHVEVTATSEGLLPRSQSFTITPENVRPKLNFINPLMVIKSNQRRLITIKATDPNQDRLTYSVKGGNDQTVKLTRQGNVWFLKPAPSYKTTTGVKFSVRVEDGRGGFDSKTFRVIVK